MYLCVTCVSLERLLFKCYNNLKRLDSELVLCMTSTPRFTYAMPERNLIRFVSKYYSQVSKVISL